ncbi:helix-turn-helix domain-containing protein [Pseudoalteromonas denitrificans]|uniref:Transcriptional regulator, AraC family n=1 Tax=Pseudoalteromonas denitrificans DSM 6059 TaxID=1123010 RepID=A0A1I1U7C3_9GAMM|nr:AraC family transcriptional regulator [Pseudoalteromonas denitrificans]SFD65468.1 transcriptional regulator, AraC family [Pseudoalteromonas denitrificans DSM 6059]
MLIEHFSIRSYSKQLKSHVHQYHQLVLPLHGTINIKVGEYAGKVNIGECLIIKANQIHDFNSEQAARFIVVDTFDLPSNILSCCNEKISISSSLLALIQFIETQLNSQANTEIEASIFVVFNQLLAQLPCLNKRDKRIEKVLEIINQDLAHNHTIDELSSHACLSKTQFKINFKKSMDITSQAYITQCRMEKAKALLIHTDTPISIVAQKVGYQNASAFSRKFKIHFGDSPHSYTS